MAKIQGGRVVAKETVEREKGQIIKCITRLEKKEENMIYNRDKNKYTDLSQVHRYMVRKTSAIIQIKSLNWYIHSIKQEVDRSRGHKKHTIFRLFQYIIEEYIIIVSSMQSIERGGWNTKGFTPIGSCGNKKTDILKVLHYLVTYNVQQINPRESSINKISEKDYKDDESNQVVVEVTKQGDLFPKINNKSKKERSRGLEILNNAKGSQLSQNFQFMMKINVFLWNIRSVRP